MRIQLGLLESLLPKPFDYSGDTEEVSVEEAEEVDLFEDIYFDPSEDIEEILNAEAFDVANQ